MAFVKGIAISGEMIEKLKDKHFIIVQEPIYETKKDLKTDKDVEILRIVVELATQKKVFLDYYPNKTSIKTLVNKKGMDMANWVGHAFEFYTNKQNAFGKEQTVIYVKE